MSGTARISTEGFRVLMRLIEGNEDFRQRLLSDDPSQALVLDG
ncbi:unnamed protein product, partial [marine sediment metagenome]